MSKALVSVPMARRMGLSAQTERADVYAVRALVKGEASPEQQKRALGWIIHQCSQANAVVASADAHEAAFCNGRRSVGIEIGALIYEPVTMDE